MTPHEEEAPPMFRESPGPGDWDAAWQERAHTAPERDRDDPRLGLDGGPPWVRWAAWFDAAAAAIRDLYDRHGWAPVIAGPLPRHTVSGWEQTLLVSELLSRGDPAAMDGALDGVAAALDAIEAEAAAAGWRREIEEAIRMPGKGFTKRNPHGKSVKHSKIYAALRKEGMPKGQAAAISNATTPKHSAKGKGKGKGK